MFLKQLIGIYANALMIYSNTIMGIIVGDNGKDDKRCWFHSI